MAIKADKAKSSLRHLSSEKVDQDMGRQRARDRSFWKGKEVDPCGKRIKTRLSALVRACTPRRGSWFHP